LILVADDLAIAPCLTALQLLGQVLHAPMPAETPTMI
jgi:hypothetical protein